MIRVALLSKWHVHAVDYAKQAQDHPNLSIEAVWDEEAARGREWAEELGVDFIDRLEDIWNDSSIDGVIVTTPTSMHKEVITAAAEHGKHIFTEKVLTLSGQECREVLDTIEKCNVNFMISLPRLTEDYYIYAHDTINDGKLGTVNMLRCRVAHNGAVDTKNHPNGWLPGRFFNEEQCGGGAFIDLGAHPIYLANRLLGQPSAVSARLKSLLGRGVDDHSAAIVEYQSGALASLETSFLSSGSPFQLEIYGTEGTILIEDKHIRMKGNGRTDEWIEPKRPAPLAMPLEQWAAAIENGEDVSISMQDALHLTLINEAAARSHQEGRRVTINQ
ncbi:Gfo/Idh/MocA family oxidoreductase [Halobacillus salinarum]|uniref:Gfo/Idh/MocA family oxidoreductase n=1 Tax=Halobacillus salinarum TaxID=2932257 RepID=A0ABY4EIM0_9BACI|nr:Gfo/Idh/MocA family oxidoreductase [Halobacillus salinarum]UOQ43936.1 Gfo/Idh/MocA family oxidoreductase [Halobacillus salinarum]